jgi:hypothetical protein
VFPGRFGEDLGLADRVGAKGEGFDEFFQGMLDFEGADEADESAEGATVPVLDRRDGAPGKTGALGEFSLVQVLAKAILFESLADEFLQLAFGESRGLFLIHFLREISVSLLN